MFGIFFKINDRFVELHSYYPSSLTIYNLQGEYIDSFKVYPTTDFSDSIYNVILKHFQNQRSNGLAYLADTIETHFKTGEKLIDIDSELWRYLAPREELDAAGLVEPEEEYTDEEDTN